MPLNNNPTPKPRPRVLRSSTPIDPAELRKKLAAASGGSISATPMFRNIAIVAKYSGNVHNRGSAIRAKCIDCSCGMIAEVSRCEVTRCALHLFRKGDDPFRKARRDGDDPPVVPPYSEYPAIVASYSRIRNRGTAIRAKCMECMNGQRELVRSCHITSCALHGFRMGSDPHRAARAEAAIGEDGEPVIEDDDEEDIPEGEE